MAHDYLTIAFDGEEIETVYSDLLQLAVELDDGLAAMFRLKILLIQTAEGWTHIDEKHFQVWTPVSISAGFEDDVQELLTGFITHVKPRFQDNTEQAYLEIWGMDASVMMDRVEWLKDWPNKTDSDIATEIFKYYGLTPQVEATEFSHDEANSTIIQRETDMQFLKRLAIRNGYECFVKGSEGFFGLPKIEDEPQPLLAVHFGKETNIHNFSIDVDAMAPVNVGMFQVDRKTKDVIDVNVDSTAQTTLGGIEAAGLLKPGMDTPQVYVSHNGAAAQSEMESLCQGLYNRSEWFVFASGEVNANHYSHVLMPRKPVTVKGIGETYSGMYYVNHVTHVFTSDGYSQQVRMKRNGLHLVGDEDFGESGGLLSAL
ncbi:phage late control D family protein [Teredinibacter purpureus]|uniref:phage late control D family protein n=1 Tax=Teredinibacter purpureus TaxID=2731756 RepID=UPI0005F868FA|nr:contractile injection system protein, VgrG/Pvc8 family [Teredinibacter purpureus]